MRLRENEDYVIMRLLRKGEVAECVNATERALRNVSFATHAYTDAYERFKT